jgi:hypothetical protein
MPMLASTNGDLHGGEPDKVSMAASECDRTINPAIARASASSCVLWSALPQHRRSLSTPAIEQMVMSMHLKISTAISSRLTPSGGVGAQAVRPARDSRLLSLGRLLVRCWSRKPRF